MFSNVLKSMKEFIQRSPKSRKGVGILFVFLGLVALITPLTPGSWLVFVGLELLGIRVLLFDKLKFSKKLRSSGFFKGENEVSATQQPKK